MLPEIAQAVDLAVVALKAGVRLIYLGLALAGALGLWMHPNVRQPSACRMAGWWILIAGGYGALLRAVEDAEDDVSLGVLDL